DARTARYVLCRHLRGRGHLHQPGGAPGADVGRCGARSGGMGTELSPRHPHAGTTRADRCSCRSSRVDYRTWHRVAGGRAASRRCDPDHLVCDLPHQQGTPRPGNGAEPGPCQSAPRALEPTARHPKRAEYGCLSDVPDPAGV
ncbi:MAG: hypothetical protein AVDCRST_MAG89-190, partial [uncultured Gemmatimonadetes bacterium]